MRITYKTKVQSLSIVENKCVGVIKIPDPGFAELGNYDPIRIPGDGLVLNEEFEVTITNEHNMPKSTNE